MIQIVPWKDGSFFSSGKNWELQFDSPKNGLFQFTLEKNLKLTSRFALLDSLEESTALPARRKVHHSNDGMEASLETAATIPFGAEPSISRMFRLSEGLLTVTTDFAIRPSFAIRTLFAGGYTLEGSIARIAVTGQPETGVFLPAPEWRDFGGIAEKTVLYDAAQPPVSILLETIEGSILELSTGEDFWRWTANLPHITSRYTVTRTVSGLEITWLPYEFKPAPDVEVPAGRARRMNFILAWKKKTKNTKKIDARETFDMAAFDWPESCLAQDSAGNPVKGAPCFAAPGVTNILKKWVRRNLALLEEGDVLAVTNVNPTFCHAASHQDRAKQKILPHLDLYGINEFQLWANRQMARQGAKLVIFSSGDVELPSVQR